MGIGHDSGRHRILMLGIGRLNILLLVALETQAFIPTNPLWCLVIHLRQFRFENQRQLGCILKPFHSGGSKARPSASQRNCNVLKESELVKSLIAKQSNHGPAIIKKGRERIAWVCQSLQMYRERASLVDREAFLVDRPGLSKVIIELLLHH